MTQFAKRKIDVKFTMGPVKDIKTGATSQPTFTESGTNEVLLSGYRAQANIIKAGGLSMGGLQLRIYGISLSLMNQLSFLGKIPLATRNNTVTVSAGDDINGMSVVYVGNINAAYADMQGAPDVVFVVQASAGLFEAINPIKPNSYQGSASVSVIMAGLANQMGKVFEDNGVNVKLSNPYFPGTARAQAEACARAADINWIIDNNTLAIWPKDGSRGSAIPLVSPDTGLVGYPTYTGNGIGFICRYNPSIGFGAMVEVKSSLTPACGKWVVYYLAYELESETNGGVWFTRVEAAEPGYVVVR